MPKLIKVEAGYKFPNTHCIFIKEVEPHITGGGSIKRKCEALCTYKGCNKYFICQLLNLSNGHTKTCGCLQRESISKTNNKNRLDLTNKRFALLTARRVVGHTKARKALWLCDCDCGGTAITIGSKLVSGWTTSCGHSKNPTQLGIFINIVQPLFPEAVSEFRLSNKQFVDIAIERLKLAIEYDGRQHTETMYYDKGDLSKLEGRKAADLKKNELLKSIGWRLLRIPECEYKKNPELWNETIIKFLTEPQV
jgi:hypothetical protein